MVKDLLPDHAEQVAERGNWSTGRKYPYPWYMDVTSFEQRLRFFRELIRRYGAVGVFTVNNPSQPVAWTLRKSGTVEPLDIKNTFWDQ